MHLLTVNPIAFKLFSSQISWNSILIMLALLAMLIITLYHARYSKIQTSTVYTFGIFAVLAGFVFSRLFYVMFNPAVFADQSVPHALTDGGYSLYGAFFGVLLCGVFYFSITHKLPQMLTMLDMMAPGAAMAIAIGRWGNFFNQESYGPAPVNSALMKFPFAVYIETLDEWRYALFLLESLVCIGIFFALFSVKRKYVRSGAATVFFLLYYATARTVIESLREDSMYLGFVRASQIFGILLILSFFIYYITKLFKKTGFRLSYLTACILFIGALTAGFLSQFFVGANNLLTNTVILVLSMLVMMYCTSYAYKTMYKTKFILRCKDIFSDDHKKRYKGNFY